MTALCSVLYFRIYHWTGQDALPFVFSAASGAALGTSITMSLFSFVGAAIYIRQWQHQRYQEFLKQQAPVELEITTDDEEDTRL